MLKLIKALVKKDTRINATTQIANVFKTNNQIIQQIHDEFYSEVNLLLADAKVSVSEDTELTNVIEKAEKLKSLGFGNTKECKDALEEQNRLQNAKSINNSKRELTNAINYFSQKYPLYKFITEESVKKICSKYNLIYGTVDRYIGTVPDKNLKQIESFKIDEDDDCYEETQGIFRPFGDSYNILQHRSGKSVRVEKEIKDAQITREKHERNESRNPMGLYEIQLANQQFNGLTIGRGRIEISKCKLEIAAPISDFNTNGMELKDFQLTEIHIPDPVVLKPVFYGGKKHYLIVSAWGLEASDELVVNQKMN